MRRPSIRDMQVVRIAVHNTNVVHQSANVKRRKRNRYRAAKRSTTSSAFCLTFAACGSGLIERSAASHLCRTISRTEPLFVRTLPGVQSHISSQGNKFPISPQFPLTLRIWGEIPSVLNHLTPSQVKHLNASKNECGVSFPSKMKPCVQGMRNVYRELFGRVSHITKRPCTHKYRGYRKMMNSHGSCSCHTMQLPGLNALRLSNILTVQLSFSLGAFSSFALLAVWGGGWRGATFFLSPSIWRQANYRSKAHGNNMKRFINLGKKVS